MKLIKFRIQYYKSIKDSGWCWLASDLTILAGKNESGKTAILEALRDFYDNATKDPREPPKEVIPLDRSGKPVIEMCFKVEEDFFDKIRQAKNIDIPRAIEDDITKNGLTISYNYKDYYTVFKDLSNVDNSINKESLSNEILKYISETSVPKYIFYSEVSDILPFEIPLEKAKNNEMVKDFATVLGIDLNEVLRDADIQRRKILIEGHSATLSEDFMGYWKQDKITLTADIYGDNLIIAVKESGNTIPFKPEQRSKGLQWFLSFYLRLKARGSDINIFLIDEPGLYLHAKAQNDVLKFLEKISEKSQVIFTTHSPYLIDSDRLDRVRLILKDDNSTKIGKIQKGADAETLTPIITAIGLDLTQQFSIAGKKNVLLEGISDYYYLQSFKYLLSNEIKRIDVNFIPCVGAPKIPQIASLLIGWDLEFVAVLDNDKEGKGVAKTLREKLDISKDRIIHISLKESDSIEDLFTHHDFNQYVLDDVRNDNQSVPNSKFLKDKQLDKVLLSKIFFDCVRKNNSNVRLSEDTANNFKAVFEKIAQYFDNLN